MTVRMRHTKGHRNNRRSHHALENPAISKEGETKVPHLRHRASPVTGTYRGRKVIDVDAKLAKKAAKQAALADASAATE
ncbi:MAG: ribosomal protein large subunit ribosomal protein [Candidatus Parcubacteria bacterium]|jgi:ribosomal protein L32